MSLLVLARNSKPDSIQSAVIISGVLLAAFWASTVWSGASILRRDRQNGTLGATVVSVHDARLVFLGRVAGAGAATLIGVLATVLVSAYAFGLTPVFEAPVAAVAGLGLTLLTGASASLLVGSILLVSRHGDHISNALGIPITLLGGTVIPIDVLPDWVQPVSWLISLSWIQRWMQGAVVGELQWASLSVGVLLTLAYALAGALILTQSLRKARAAGSLELY